MVMIELIIGVGIPLTATAIGVVRYFWKKEKCFIAMKTKIDELSKHDTSASEVHNGHDVQIKEIQTRQAKNEIYLKLILDEMKINYSD